MPILMAGVILGATLYLVLREALFAGIDTRAPYLVVLVTGLPIIGLAQALAAYVGRGMIVRWSPAWIAEITPRGESSMLLEMFVRSL
jgi:hypothetical protein